MTMTQKKRKCQLTPLTGFRRAPFTLAVLAAGCSIAACGSSSSSGSASASASSAAGSAGATRSSLRACLKAHGVTLPARPPGSGNGPPAAGAAGAGGASGAGGAPGAGGGFFGGGGGARNANPKFRAALQACGGRGFGGRPGAGRISHATIEKFVACVRAHGYNLPSPNFSGKGPVFPANVRTDAKFRAASRACTSLLFPRPGGGPPQSTNPTS